MANIIVDVGNAAQRISAEMFKNNFDTCIDIEFSELKENWKTYSNFSVTECRIRLQPGNKVNIQDFFQLRRDRISLDKGPSLMCFNVAKKNNLIERYNTHNKWTDDASNMASPRKWN